MTSFWAPLLVISIVLCCVFAVAAFVFLFLWLISLFRGGLQKSCPSCGALVPLSSLYCTHCGKELPHQTRRRGSRSFLILFAVSLVLTGLSVGGIVYSAVSSGIGASEFTEFSLNLNQHSTSSGWNITFDEVRGGRLKKNILITNGKPTQLHVQSHVSSGTMQVTVTQGTISKGLDLSGTAEDSTVDLSGFEDGRATITVTIDNAKNGSITMWWE